MRQASLTLGQKIKNFRKKAAMSQLDLETAISTSAGSISRIEKDKVTPTRETLTKISQELKLNKTEVAYLFDIGSGPVTEDEVTQARAEVAHLYANSPVVGFLLDDRWQIIKLSKSFIDLFEFTEDEENQFLFTNILEGFFDPANPFFQRLDSDYRLAFCAYLMSRKKAELEHLHAERWVEELLELLHTYPDFDAIWASVQKEPKEILSNRSRTIHFRVQGKTTPMLFGREVLKPCPRFYLVEFSRAIE